MAPFRLPNAHSAVRRERDPPKASGAAGASVWTETWVRHAKGEMTGTDFGTVAVLVGEPARAAMLDALLDGKSRPAGELAKRAGVAASTASEHLARLLAGRLVCREVHGRERRYRLASAEVAAALEALALVAPAAAPRSLRAADRHAAMRTARTCYDHLAGFVGVAVTEALVGQRALLPRDGAYALTSRGEELLAGIGVDVVAARVQRRLFARACLDWSERRDHLAGALGAGVAQACLANGWVQRRPSDRALTITPAGARGLRDAFGIEIVRAAG
jgi:DNA-binding transcriptional ArsR family regulator